MTLTLTNLTKQYGNFTALENFTYDFTAGVYGLLGPNGAGKSTLMNIITDNLKPTSGSVKFDGVETSTMDADFRKILGFMPQQQGIYPNFTLERFLYYMAALKGMKKADAKPQIEKLINLVNLQDSRNKRLGGFSGGMKQRALIAQAMLGEPKVIILDEPTAASYPLRKDRRQSVRDNRRREYAGRNFRKIQGGKYLKGREKYLRPCYQRTAANLRMQNLQARP